MIADTAFWKLTTSFQTWNRRVRSRRYSLAFNMYRREQKWARIGPKVDKNRWAWPADVKQRMVHSRWRIG